MSRIWDSLPRQHYLSLAPWCWVQLESGEAPGPFPFVAGIAPEVVAGLHEAHSLLSSSIDTAISDVFSKRAPLDDPDRQRRLEDAYAELVNSRPYLKQHIRCGRKPDGTFQWEFPTDPTKSATVTNGGLRIFHIREAAGDSDRVRPATALLFKDIARLMDLSKPETRALKRMLRDMLRQGEIVLNRKGLYGPAEEMNLATGYFAAHRDGYGFVISEKPGERDFFIPPKGTLGAMKGDRVMVRVENWKKREARIMRILERVHAKVLGTFDITKTGAFVKPKDRSIPFDLYVAPQDRGMAKNRDMDR